MNPPEWKPQWKTSDEPSNEGRETKPDGTSDDARFHKDGFGTSKNMAETDLKELEAVSIATSEQQADYLATLDSEFGKRAYRQLIETYPTHERAMYWKKILEKMG